MNRDETPGKAPIPTPGGPEAPLFPDRPEMGRQGARTTVVPSWRLDEKRAARFGKDLLAVEDLLRRAAAGVKDPTEREALREARFIASAATLVAAGGLLALEWRVRRDPTVPPGPGNEQDPRGAAILVRLATPPGR